MVLQKIFQKGSLIMRKAIPIIITNTNILVYSEGEEQFKPFSFQGLQQMPNIPFYHSFAQRIAESQHYFKEFFKKLYPIKSSRNVFAIIVPDDTSPLESIFINEFFLNSGTCKAVAQMHMSQTLSKDQPQYISISKSSRNVVLQYIKNNEIVASRYYDSSSYDPERIILDSQRIHIDVEYENTPVFVNNFNMNMDDFFEAGEIISQARFMDKIAVIDVEKL